MQIIRKTGQILSKISNIAAKKVQKMTCAKLFKLMSFFAARANADNTNTHEKTKYLQKEKSLLLQNHFFRPGKLRKKYDLSLINSGRRLRRRCSGC